MIDTVESKREEINAACLLRRVEMLELFGSGSGSSPSFDPVTSDLDFLVRFQPMTPIEHADCYFRLLEDLEMLFARPVDLVEVSPIRNPYFLKAIASTRVVLYAA